MINREVDDEMVYRTLREHLDDFDRFRAAIYAYLRRSVLFEQADGENAWSSLPLSARGRADREHFGAI